VELTDIMQTWKENRFIVADPALELGDIVIVLTDYQFWTAHLDELLAWCRATPGVSNEGMTVVCDSQHTLVLFLLRWS
jgi:hypothetical protein